MTIHLPDGGIYPTVQASIAAAELEAAYAALARLPGAVRAACDRVVAAERAVSRATACPFCEAGVDAECAADCPEAPSSPTAVAAEFFAQMG